MRSISKGFIASTSLLLLLAGCQRLTSENPAATSEPAKPAESPVERGKYLVTVGGCHDCHSPKVFGPNGPDVDMARLLSGNPADDKLPKIPANQFGPAGWGTTANNHLGAWVGPWGVSFAMNLTPDKDTGLGSWTEEMFVKAIRTGKHMGTGRDIQLMQPNSLPNTTAPATSNVIGARFGLTISDTDPAMKVYRDLLGFKPEIDSAFSSEQPLQDLWNTRAQFRRSNAKIPGSAVEMEFLEFKGIERKTVEARIQDPGSTRFQLRVRDTDVAVKPLVAAGSKVITTGGDGGPILMSGLRVAIVRELNNLFLVIMSQPPRPAAQ